MRSSHRREYLADRITSSLDSSDETPLGTDRTQHPRAGKTPNRPQKLLAAALILGALAAPVVFLLILLNR